MRCVRMHGDGRRIIQKDMRNNEKNIDVMLVVINIEERGVSHISY